VYIIQHNTKGVHYKTQYKMVYIIKHNTKGVHYKTQYKRCTL